jgi:membrane protease YdiL (CAAX protease family)
MSDVNRITEQPKKTDKKASITGYGGLSSFFVAIGCFLFPQLLAGFWLGIYSALGGDFNEKNILQYFALDLFVELVTVGFLALFLKRKKRTLRDVLGKLTDKIQLFWVPVAFVLYMIAVTLAYSLVQVVSKSVDLNQEQENTFKAAASHPEIVLAFFALVVVTPIVEEFIFRGFLYRSLKSSVGKIWAAIIASGLFALAHGQLNVGIDTFILSLFLIALLEKTSSLVPSILLHAVKNFFAFIIIFGSKF